MLSSHRLLSTATHTGDGVFGVATGKKLVFRIVADCHAINNQINDEWMIRDQGAIVRQLGWTPKEYAYHLIELEGGSEKCSVPFHPDVDIQGPYRGKGNDNEYGQRYADVLHRIMSADLACVESEYDRACQVEYPGGYTGHSHVAVDKFWLGLRASFPNAEFKIEHQIGRDDPMMPPRAAIRFSITGKHEGWGTFGKPTGANVHVMAAAHVEFGPWGIRREFVVFDETVIWKQIALHTG